EKAAVDVSAGSEGLLVMPYWAGVMSPYWDGAARGAIVGLSLDHEPKHLFRAVLEGIAFEQAIASEAMETQAGGKPAAVIAAGGWFPSPETAAEAMAARPTRHVEPVEGLISGYRARKAIYRDLYRATRDIHARLDALSEASG
ncbi:MAG: xylulose kinase, partial [Mesorhizobium sp.]